MSHVSPCVSTDTDTDINTGINPYIIEMPTEAPDGRQYKDRHKLPGLARNLREREDDAKEKEKKQKLQDLLKLLNLMPEELAALKRIAEAEIRDPSRLVK